MIGGFVARRWGADWLVGRRSLLRTAVARRVEVLINTDFLELPRGEGAAARNQSALPGGVVTPAPSRLVSFVTLQIIALWVCSGRKSFDGH